MTAESVREELGSFNPLEVLQHPEVTGTAIRTVPMLGGTVVGAVLGGRVGAPKAGAALGGAAGSSLGYLLDQWRSGREVSLPVMGLEAGLGAIPGGRAGATMLRNIARRAVQGGLFGLLGGGGRKVLEEGELPTAEEALVMSGTGAALGGVLGGVESRLRGRPRVSVTGEPTPPPRVPIAALPPAPPGATGDLPIFPGLSPGQLFEAKQAVTTKVGKRLERQRIRARVEAEQAAEKAKADILEVERIARERGGLVPTGHQVSPQQAVIPPVELGRLLTPAEIRAAAEGRLPVPPGRGLQGGAAPSDPTATGYPTGPKTPTVAPEPLPPPNVAPVVYSGFQEGFGDKPGFHLYTLTEDLSPTLVKGSTVNARTLRQAGFEVPPPTTPTEFHAGLPIPQSVRKAVRRVFTGEEAPGARAQWWQRSPTILNRSLGTAPDGEGIGDKLFAARKVTDQRLGQAAVILETSHLRALTPAEDVNLMRVFEGREAPMNTRVQQVAAQLVPFTRQIGQRFKAKGALVLRDTMYDTTTGAVVRRPQWKPFELVTNYYPRMLDPRLVVKRSSAELTSDLLAANRTRISPADARDMAIGLQAQARGDAIPQHVSAPIRTLIRQGGPGAGFLHERTGWVIPDSILMRPKDALPRYFDAAAREEGFLDTFGPGDTIVNQAIARAQATGRPDVQMGIQEWEALRNRTVRSPMAEGLTKTAQLAQNLTTATLLGPKTALKQLSQIGMAFGSDIRMRSLLKGSTHAFRKHGRQAAEIAGAITDGVRADMELAGRVHTSFLPSDTLLEKAVKVSGRLATTVVEKSMITTMDSVARSFAYHGALQDFLAYQRAAQAGSARAVKTLAEFRLTPTSTRQQLETASSHMADLINLRADSLEIPAFFYRLPGLSAVKHLNNFNLVMTRKVLTQYIQPLGKAIAEKDTRETVRQLMRIGKFGAAMTITGEVLGDTLAAISGRSDDRPGGALWEFADGLAQGEVPAQTIMARVANDVLTAGTFGYLQAIQGAIYAAGGAKEIRARLTGAVVGAPLGSALEAASHAAALATADREPRPTTGRRAVDRAQQEATRALIRRVPIVGAHAVDVLQAAGTIPGSRPSEQRRAVEAIARAERRRDAATAQQWREWYRQRHGTSLPESALKQARESSR